MTDWTAVRAEDFAVPADRPLGELVSELSELLRSADPTERDSTAYSTLATWIGRGVLSGDQLRELGDEMARRFGDAEIQARTFAPLILDCIVSAGVYEASWVPPFERWYVAETDLRGYDAKLGWLHAVAHGADLLGTLGLYPAVEPVEMLRLGIGRLLTPTEHVLRDMEDDRLSYALACTLTRSELTVEDATDWLVPAFTGITPVGLSVSPVNTNTTRTLRALYVLVDRGVRLPEASDVTPVPHSAEIKAQLVEVLRLVSRSYF
ncbi:DUF2785 domain-containing protein [Kribbella sp. NPDC051587]|uniref:DUF2785 domain-containing protein n=1 Tax=Kribbella sp. NPDC051587 TaxID=3364119 RepID=UPI0037B34A5E